MRGGGGGGSGPSGPVASTSQFPIEAAVSAWVQGSHSFTLNATDTSNNTYTFTYSFTPGATSTFEGQSARTASTSGIIKKNGVLISSGSGTEYYQVGPYKWLGDIDSTGEYEVATSSTLLPATATVGQAGALIVSTQYTSNLKTSVVYNETTTWSLEADTANTAWFCMNSTVVYTDGVTPNFNEADCYKIDVNGNVLGYRMTISQGTSTLTFQ